MLFNQRCCFVFQFSTIYSFCTQYEHFCLPSLNLLNMSLTPSYKYQKNWSFFRGIGALKKMQLDFTLVHFRHYFKARNQRSMKFSWQFNFPFFGTSLEFRDILILRKKMEKLDKSNYRPVSILPVNSKIYERLIYDQMHKYFDQIFSKFQCGFRKGFSTQNCLLYMIENWKESLDQGGHYGILISDLSKEFDCIMHDLLIAKLQAYGFDNDSLNFICNYLVGREQRIKINSSFATRSKIENGVPQGSILGPLLFSINILDMFF